MAGEQSVLDILMQILKQWVYIRFPLVTFKNAEKWLPPHPAPAATDIHVKSPNRSASLFPAFDIGIGGPVYQFNPPQSYWGTKNPFGGGGSTYKVPSGLQYSKDLEINLRSWRNSSTGIIHAYHQSHWGNWMFKLNSRNEVRAIRFSFLEMLL